MNSTLDISKSVMRQLSNGFVDGLFLDGAVNVYGEADLLANTIPTFPFVYLLDFGIVFEKKHLPVIISQPVVMKIPLGMGEWGWYVDLQLHIFAASRGQRYQLSGSIMEHTNAFDIYNFTVPASPTLIEQVQLETWLETYQAIPVSASVEGSLANWVTLSTNFTSFHRR